MKFLSFLISALLITGCAHPKYVETTSAPPDRNRPTEASENCQLAFPKSGLCLQYFWEKLLTAEEPGTLIVKTYRLNHFDKTRIPQDVDQELTMEPWMPGMNHGSTPTRTERLDTGTYRIHDVFLIMPGQWEFRFQQRQNQNLIDELSLPFVF